MAVNKRLNYWGRMEPRCLPSFSRIIVEFVRSSLHCNSKLRIWNHIQKKKKIIKQRVYKRTNLR